MGSRSAVAREAGGYQHAVPRYNVALSMRAEILKLLSGGDRRSIGQANRVAALASKDTTVFRELVEGLTHEDPLVRMRSADALEKASPQRQRELQKFKRKLLDIIGHATDQEVRWHLCQIVPRLQLSARERDVAVEGLRRYLDDRSSIVKTFALQAIVELSQQDPALKAESMVLIRESCENGTPAMRARGRKLLATLESPSSNRLAAKRFEPETLAAFEATKYMYIRSGQHRFIAVWVVVVNGRVIVRSWNDKPSGWYRAFLEEPRGDVRLHGKDSENVSIRAVPLRSARLNDAASSAYAAKYPTKANAKYVTGFKTAKRKATTLELLPA